MKLNSFDDLQVRLPIISFKIHEVLLRKHNNQPVWLILLSVGNGSHEVKGVAFMESGHIELRFERDFHYLMPGFVTGHYLEQDVNDSSLTELYNNPTKECLEWAEGRIRKFLFYNCRFSVSVLIDATTGRFYKKVTYCRVHRNYGYALPDFSM
ncbi:hypothetical protein OR1_02156 [Geobacter sp. OR-1]|uniref:hypothetical protein n=1 Tax=Geobacter sp. OR-1 TaxID=1266765 RepID=UPI0005440D20|nr:hypothetical protein [Geobacter sp. OR-1]GAM09874.1 hypothetical protein OR1_02156 [Geobacter sp. OR-1]